VRRRRTLLVLLLVVTTVLGFTKLLTHDSSDADANPAAAQLPDGGSTGGGQVTTSSGPTPSGAPVAKPKLLGEVALLGPRTLATVPAGTTKAVVVRGDGPATATATIELYALVKGAWVKQSAWRGHLGAKGWTADHREGDLRTPAGTYTLSDAGGRLENPGTKLPYHRSAHFVPSGSSVFGDSLAGSFDYVIAIDFNRLSGVSPLDGTHPQGDARGGGIWLHVDHDGPTHGCVSVPREGMKALLRALAPQDHPVVIMGDKSLLAT
jgi:L,D-peptidoglycan transpeptidase YkuD (ErfK/YbiS/YcfS/YnhG family)